MGKNCNLYFHDLKSYFYWYVSLSIYICVSVMTVLLWCAIQGRSHAFESEGAQSPKATWALLAWKSGRAQVCFYYYMAEKVGGGQAPRAPYIDYGPGLLSSRIFPFCIFYQNCYNCFKFYSELSSCQAWCIKRLDSGEIFIYHMKNCRQGGKICNLPHKNLWPGWKKC